MKNTILVLFTILFSINLFAGERIPGFIDLMVYSEKPSSRMYEVKRIAPIGWSKDGKFGFIKEDPVEGRGGVIYRYTILNTVDDNVAWLQLHDTFDDENTNNDFTLSYKKHKKTFLEALEKYNIIQGEGIKFLDFPYIEDKNNSYDIELKTTKWKKKNPFRGDIKTLKVYATLNSSKKKRISSKNKSIAFSYWVAGYFKSPFENRILVLVGEEEFGFEGTEGDFLFIGCHTKLGFKTRL